MQTLCSIHRTMRKKLTGLTENIAQSRKQFGDKRPNYVLRSRLFTHLRNIQEETASRQGVSVKRRTKRTTKPLLARLVQVAVMARPRFVVLHAQAADGQNAPSFPSSASSLSQWRRQRRSLPLQPAGRRGVEGQCRPPDDSTAV